MKKDSLKKKLKQNQLTIGSWITMGEEIVAEIMAKLKFDWLVVDMEHRAIDLQKTQNLVRIIDLCGCVPLVRISENNPSLIKRVMDTGAHGVIVPMVNTKEDALKAVQAVKYPPFGKRGVGLARAQGYGTAFKEYKDWLKAESIVIVQVEHIESVENLDEILSVEGVDGFIVGPYDLSGSLGRPGEFSHPLVTKNLREVMRIARLRKANAGIHVIEPEPDQVSRRIKEGYRLIAFSLDTLFLSRNCESLLAKIHRRKT